MLLFLAIVCLGSAVFFLGEVVTFPMRERRSLLTRAAQYGQMRVSHGRELPRFKERALAPIVSKLARLMLRVNPKSSLDVVSAKLAAAGMRRTSPATFLAMKAGLGIGGAPSLQAPQRRSCAPCGTSSPSCVSCPYRASRRA